MSNPIIADPSISTAAIPNPSAPEPKPAIEAASPAAETATESTESFDQIFTQYEKNRQRKRESGDRNNDRQLEGTVLVVSADTVFVDIGYKSEGILPRSTFEAAGEDVKPGDKLRVSVKGRDADGYYELSRFRVEQPKDWTSLEQAFTSGTAITGTVTAVIKGGFSVDVGVRAFMPASRSGVRDAAEMEKLVGQDIRCRIIKLDVGDEDIVVDRRALAEEEERSIKDRRYSQIQEGDTLMGTVRSLTDYGAFVDLGGVDALLHVGEVSWSRIGKPSDVLSINQEVEVKVIKVTNETNAGDDRKKQRRIAVSLKQLQPHPWDAVAGKYVVGERVRGTVTRVMEFGAFVELEPGIEGLIHVSEMSWAKKVRIASDVLKPGETVEAVILGVNAADHKLALGLKQTLGDPWSDAAQKFAAGSVVEGTVTSITKFGAFVQLAEGVEGMIHISEMSADKRINHPQEMLKLGQVVQTQVLAVDKEKRQLKLSMKQLVPTGLDEYIAEHKAGDVVSGRLIEVSSGTARVELGQGIQAPCRLVEPAKTPAKAEPARQAKADLSALSSMLKERWKSGPAPAEAKPETFQAGQVRSFRITKLDPTTKKIELEMA